MSTIPSGSLPPMLPQQMASILGDSSAVQAFEGASTILSAPTAGAFLDLSPEAVQLSASQQVQMAELSDDSLLFGGTAGSSPFSEIAPSTPSPDPSSYDPTQDVANPAYLDPVAPAAELWA